MCHHIMLRTGSTTLLKLVLAIAKQLNNMPGHLLLKQEALGSIPGSGLGFSSSSWLTNADGMKDLWCSSTVWLLSTDIQYKGMC